MQPTPFDLAAAHLTGQLSVLRFDSDPAAVQAVTDSINTLQAASAASDPAFEAACEAQRRNLSRLQSPRS